MYCNIKCRFSIVTIGTVLTKGLLLLYLSPRINASLNRYRNFLPSIGLPWSFTPPLLPMQRQLSLLTQKKDWKYFHESSSRIFATDIQKSFARAIFQAGKFQVRGVAKVRGVISLGRNEVRKESRPHRDSRRAKLRAAGSCWPRSWLLSRAPLHSGTISPCGVFTCQLWSRVAECRKCNNPLVRRATRLRCGAGGDHDMAGSVDFSSY
jgi:hypothetical protein